MISDISNPRSETSQAQSAPRIAVLDDAVIDQIAAGEVVERPASVVKELLENALDAGAKHVVVEVDGGGVERIVVLDDGHGMTPTELPLALCRHATSKIRSHDDLARIGSYGFRGEALPTIASVSKLQLISRTPDVDAATMAIVEGGGSPALRPAGSPVGTRVEVSDLFYNVPARRKFLKSPATEQALISEVCLRVALQAPAVHLTLFRNGKRSREFPAVASLKERAAAAFRNEHLHAVVGERDGVSIEAYLTAPERARAGAKGLHVLVNGRPLRDRALARSIAFAYGSVLPPGRYPLGVVSIRVDPRNVDVNVHPQKAEVRFSEGRKILDTVTRILAAALGHQPWQPPSSGGGPHADPASVAQDHSATDRKADLYWQARLAGGLSVPTEGENQRLASAAPREPYTASHLGGPPHSQGDTTAAQVAAAPLATGPFGSLRVVAQVRKMILICEGPDALVLVDQHAADERIRYAKLRRSFETQNVAVQRLLFPERFEVREEEATFAAEATDALTKLGLEISRIGPTTLAVAAVPSLVRRASPTLLARAALDELNRTGEREFGDRMDTALATMACHASIRAGDSLSIQEGQALLRALDEVDAFSGHCPHGRPILMEMPWTNIEGKLGR